MEDPIAVLVAVPAALDAVEPRRMICAPTAWITTAPAVSIPRVITSPCAGAAGKVTVKAAVQKYPLLTTARKDTASSV